MSHLTITSPVGITILLLSIWLLHKTFEFVRYRTQLRKYGAVQPPSYPNKDPIFGLDLFMAYMNGFQSGTWLDLTFSHFLEYGKTFQCLYQGMHVIKTVDPEVSKCFHATNFEDFGVQPLRERPARDIFGKAITNRDGTFAQTRRAWLRPSFQRAHVANMDRLAAQIDHFMQLLPNDGETVDLAPLLGRFNLDTSSDFIFGKSLNALGNPDGFAEKFRHAFTYAVRGIAIKHMLGRLDFLHRDKAFDEARITIFEHVDQCVREALERREKRLSGKATAETRLRLVDELTEETQDAEDLRYQIISVFNPGHKLTSVILTNAFFLLARHPETWTALRAEVLETKDVTLTYDILKSYKLVNYTIRETQRLYTAATFNQRQALRDVVLPVGGGPEGKDPLFIPQGTVLEIHYRAMHRHPDIWGTDAEEFKPMRWKDARPKWAYMPFGGGPRYCVGQDLAFTEIAYMLVMMLRRFERIENRDEEKKWVEQMSMTFESKNGAKVALYRAQD